MSLLELLRLFTERVAVRGEVSNERFLNPNWGKIRLSAMILFKLPY